MVAYFLADWAFDLAIAAAVGPTLDGDKADADQAEVVMAAQGYQHRIGDVAALATLFDGS